VDGVKPSGNDVRVGSRGSYKFEWHSRDQAKRTGAAWARVAAFDDIGPGSDYESIPTPG
jgi:hypothetical protein